MENSLAEKVEDTVDTEEEEDDPGMDGHWRRRHAGRQGNIVKTEVYDNGENEQFFKHVRMNRWLSVDIMGKRFLRLNWVTSLLASVLLWGFAIACLIEPNDVLFEFKEWQTWTTQNFICFYIGTQVFNVFSLRTRARGCHLWILE
jgi:hypothetical protein